MRMALYHPQVLGFDYFDLAGAKVMATSPKAASKTTNAFFLNMLVPPLLVNLSV